MSPETANSLALIGFMLFVSLLIAIRMLLDHEVPQDLISAFAARGVSRAAYAKLEAEIVNLQQRMNILEAKVTKKNE